MYFTDAGIEELDERRGDEQVSVSWLAERLRDFVDLNPEFETAVDRLASWLARLDADAVGSGFRGRGLAKPSFRTCACLRPPGSPSHHDGERPGVAPSHGRDTS